MPDSDLPFEFNHNKGSVIAEDNVLTQSVSSDGSTVLKTNRPQPIKEYYSNKINSANRDTDKDTKTYSSIVQSPSRMTKTQQNNDNDNNYYDYVLNTILDLLPVRCITTSCSSSPSENNQWNIFRSIKTYVK